VALEPPAHAPQKTMPFFHQPFFGVDLAVSGSSKPGGGSALIFESFGAIQQIKTPNSLHTEGNLRQNLRRN
jgi:hypothetical protein